MPLSDTLHDELHEDMTGEIMKADGIGQLKRIKVVRDSEQRLGAEAGSVFCEFKDKKDAVKALAVLKGRVYDGRVIKVCFIEE